MDAFAYTAGDGAGGQDAAEVRVLANVLTYCTGKLNSDGCLPFVSTSGIPSAGDPSPFVITAEWVVPGKPGILFNGSLGPRQRPLPGRDPVREPVAVARNATPPVQSSGGSGASCSGVLALDFNAWTQSGSNPRLVVGTMVNVQAWYRDPPVPSTTGLTDALSFAVCP